MHLLRRSPRVLAVIPARLASSRLPRKPLFQLAGRPLIEWVWRRVAGMDGFAAVVVATDAPEVLEVARGFGAMAELTSAVHPSGTDRIAEMVEKPLYRGFDVVVNVQGDEPFVTAEQVHGALAALQTDGRGAGTVAAPIRSVAEWRDPAVVKVVRDDAGAALLFSRAPVPHCRDGEPDFASGLFLRHVGIYAYTRETLLRWVDLPEHPLERLERLEQLRPLAAGIPIGVETVARANGGVDTAEDAAWADRLLRELELENAFER